MGQGFRLLAPVRGLIRPSIPLPFHWRPETRSQAFSPRAMDFFLFFTDFETMMGSLVVFTRSTPVFSLGTKPEQRMRMGVLGQLERRAEAISEPSLYLL